MPAPRLLAREGKPVPEWNLSARELRAQIAAAEEVSRRAPRTLRLRPLPRLPRRELLVFPERLPRRFYLEPWPFFCRIICPPRYRVRKNQKSLTATEWARFVHAIEALAQGGVPAPTYGEFVEDHRLAMDTHPGHAWGAHTMGGHDGRNFLTWHREYLAKLETALIAMNPLVTIPYWDWVTDRAIPTQLTDPNDLAEWGVTRGTFNSAFLPSASVINSVMTSADFTTFSTALEGPHGWVHNAVGGTMGSSTSPADPLFWLHHAFIDKLWADWQVAHPAPGGNPPNMSETLQPPPIMTRTVAQVQSTRMLGYVYA
jgi:tyrosinase